MDHSNSCSYLSQQNKITLRSPKLQLPLCLYYCKYLNNPLNSDQKEIEDKKDNENKNQVVEEEEDSESIIEPK